MGWQGRERVKKKNGKVMKKQDNSSGRGRNSMGFVEGGQEREREYR